MTIAEFLLQAVLSEKDFAAFWDPGAREGYLRGRGDLAEHQIQVLLNADLSELRVKIAAEFKLGDEQVVYSTVHVIHITVY